MSEYMGNTICTWCFVIVLIWGGWKGGKVELRRMGSKSGGMCCM